MSESVFDAVSRDLFGREERGFREYGKGVRPHDGSDYLREAYEETLDLAVYLKALILEAARETERS